MKKQKTILLIASILLSFWSNAQTILNSTGGTNTIAGNTYSYSIGEMTLVNTATSANIIVTQGLLQPSAGGTRISDVPMETNQLSVYPTPSDDIINIEAHFNHSGNLSAIIYDLNGRELIQKEWQLVTGNEKNNISLNSLTSGTYMLQTRYTQGDHTSSKSFKIQKIK